jgi:hypothetical protein
MGAVMPVAAVEDNEPPPDVLYINEKLRGAKKGFGFARTMFSKLEWRTLKKFCIKEKATQVDLNRMYTRYLSSDAARVRKMRILLEDISNAFVAKSPVYQDMMQVLCPSLFLMPLEGLKEPYSNSEISFARFIMMGYIVCAQPMPDIIYDYFSISRRNIMKVSATIFAYNLQQVVKVFCSELKKSAVKRFLMEKCIWDDDEEISILSVMQMGVKYPLMFYQLFLFQRHFKRLIFGDKFWANRQKVLACRFQEPHLEYDDTHFSSGEKVAVRETARVILADFNEVATSGRRPRLDWERRENTSQKLTTECCVRVKNALGYRWARALIEESELEYPAEQTFADIPPDIDDEVRIYDKKIESDFVYNVGTGYRAWVEKHKLRNGEVVKELWHRTSGNL